jgi:hypothetical protein
MRRTLRPSLYFALVALSLATAYAQTPNQVWLPSLDRVPSPTISSLAAIEDATGEIPDSSAFAVYRWDRFPSVIVLDMADFAEQDRMFSRLAFYLEKRGYRGRLLTDAQLAGKHGWNAHDYGSEELAAFFDAAEAARFPLDPEELLLRGIALREGVIERRDDSGGGSALVPGSGAVLSISRSSSRYERMLLLAHESYHGIFFCQAEYRALCERLWEAAPSAERLFMTRLLAGLGYDPASHILVVNEYQAYLLQQPRSLAPAYFGRVGKLLAGQAGVPTAAEVLPELLRDEAALEDFLKARYAIEAGGAVLGPREGG